MKKKCPGLQTKRTSEASGGQRAGHGGSINLKYKAMISSNKIKLKCKFDTMHSECDLHVNRSVKMRPVKPNFMITFFKKKQMQLRKKITKKKKKQQQQKTNM